MRRCIVLALLLWPAAGWCGPLADAQQRLDDMDFAGALQLAAQVLASPAAEPAALVDAYRIRGLCLAATGDGEAARTAFRKALSIDPELSLSTDTSPKLSAPFYQAKAIARELQPIRLQHDRTGPRSGRPGQRLRVRLEADPLRLVRGIHLCSRSGEADWRCGATRPVAEPGEVVFTPPAAAGDGPLVYFFEALTAAGGVLARAGSRAEPFGRSSAPLADARPDAAGAGGTGQPPPAAAAVSPPWYQQWWFWTAVGAVVAGTAIGLGVGLGSADGGSVAYRVSVE